MEQTSTPLLRGTRYRERDEGTDARKTQKSESSRRKFPIQTKQNDPQRFVLSEAGQIGGQGRSDRAQKKERIAAAALYVSKVKRGDGFAFKGAKTARRHEVES